MNQIKRLRDILKPHLGWHGARLSFLALFLISLLRVKTVNLVELATGFRSSAKIESNYKRLQRFFRDFDVDYAVIAKMIVNIMNIPQPWVLSIDRTEWRFGQQEEKGQGAGGKGENRDRACTPPRSSALEGRGLNPCSASLHAGGKGLLPLLPAPFPPASSGQTWFNILMLGVVHNGVAYPLVWQILDKKGNSNTNERMDLLERFEQMFPDVQVDYLSADREFVGAEWLSYLLLEPSISFRVRIRQTDLISDTEKTLPGAVIFAHLKVGESQVLSTRRWVWGRLVYVAGLRLDDGKLLIVISDDSPQTMIADYGRRWGIETLFGMFKTRGFCLESTHFLDTTRLSKLLALLSLAMCWAVKTGEWLHLHRPIKIKKHGRKAQSVFRYGLDYLRSLVTDLDLKHREFLLSLQFLSCT